MKTDRTTGNKPFCPRPGDEEITDDTFERLMTLAIEMVETVAFEHKEDSLVPVMFIHYRTIDEEGLLSDLQGAIVMVQGMFNEPEKKYECIRSLGSKCLDSQFIPVAFFFASEAWMASGDKDDPLLNVAPSKNPNRKECLSIVGRTMNGDCKSSAIILVKRGTDNEFIKDGEVVRQKTNSGATLETPLLDQFVIGYINRAAEKYNVKLPLQ